MRLHEYEAADIFSAAGIPVPARAVAAKPEEARKIAEDLGCPVVLKAQVLAGGRSLAGGVKVAASPVEAYALSGDLLGRDIEGFPVRRLLVSKRVTIKRELYVGITVDGYEGKPVALVSAEGGMSIERVAERCPKKIEMKPAKVAT